MHQNTSEVAQGFLASLGWVDWIAISILSVFLVLGLFRGFVWQLSRIATLVAAYVVAGAYGLRVGDWFRDQVASWPSEELPVYIAYFAIFVVVLVILSIIAHYIEKLVEATGLSFYNRLGGGALGVITGGCVVLALLAGVAMFFGQEAPISKAAERSRSMFYGKQVLEALDKVVPVPRDVRVAFGLWVEPLEGDGNPDEQHDPAGAPANGERRSAGERLLPGPVDATMPRAHKSGTPTVPGQVRPGNR